LGTYLSSRWRLVFFLELLLLILWISAPVSCETETATDARTTIDEADKHIESAFKMVLEAEKYSVNISHLLQELNVAVDLMAEAEMSYRHGNFSDAIQFAELTLDRINGLEGEALELAEQGGLEYGKSLSLAVTVSTVASCLVSILGVIGWSFAKKRYLRKASRLRPGLRKDD